MTPAVAVERSTQAVRRDRWDSQDLEEATTAVPKLEDVARELADEVGAAAGDIVGDVVTSFVKQAPRLADNSELAATHLRNRQVLSEIMGASKYEEVREFTIDDPLAAATAAVAFQERLAELFRKLPPDEETNAAQAAEEALDRLLAQSGEGEGVDPDVLAGAQAAAQAAREALESKLEEQGPAIGRAVRAGLTAALDEAKDQAELAAGWGLNKSEAARMDPQSRLALAARMKTDRMRRIMERFGRLRSMWWGERQRKLNVDPEEVVDVTIGDHLARLLPAEYLGLVAPELELDFLHRLSTRRLLEYEVAGVERVGQGAVIYIEDSSGSMAGDKDELSKAFGLSLLGIAHDEGRAFHALCFGGPGEVYEFSFPSPAEFTTEKMLTFAEFFLSSSGTAFDSPLDRAMELLEAEKAATSRTTADVVFATDGAAAVTPEWLARFKERQAAVGARVYGVAIGCDPEAQPFSDICDHRTVAIADLLGGGELADVFRALR